MEKAELYLVNASSFNCWHWHILLFAVVETQLKHDFDRLPQLLLFSFLDNTYWTLQYSVKNEGCLLIVRTSQKRNMTYAENGYCLWF